MNSHGQKLRELAQKSPYQNVRLFEESWVNGGKFIRKVVKFEGEIIRDEIKFEKGLRND